MESTPDFTKKKGISPVWTLPIIALCICIWIIYTSIQNAGIIITIYFEDASGITPGKTQVIARGIPIGMVTKIEPDLSNRRIKMVVKMDKSVEDLLVEDTQFWVVRPEISAASVQGLDTLFSGSYIGMQPGTSENDETNFIGLSALPPISKETPGLHIKLRAKELGSIQNGSEIYYRNVSIGVVTQHSLAKDDNSIIINIFIEPQFVHLVRQGSRFCNASGITISGKLTNLDVRIESLVSLLKGGIVLHTPTELAATDRAEDGQIFPLYKDIESARYGIKMTLQLASSMGITEGETQVVYRGLVAGVVEKIDFNDDERHTVTAHIMLDPRAERILRQGTRFWIVRPEISIEKIKNLDILLSGPYITFIPGTGSFQNHFEILPEPPPQKPLRPGSELLLSAPESYSIQTGAPVKYKDKKVGEVLDVELDEDFGGFEILVFIYKNYEQLIQPSSVFWSDGGVTFDASLSGIHLKSNSLKAVLSGGISFITPKGSETEQTKQSAGVEFPVYANYSAAVQNSPFLQARGYSFQLQADNPETFEIGTPIYYKKIKVGKVTGFELSKDNDFILINCFIEQSFRDTINASSRFYGSSGVTLKADLSGLSVDTESLQTIVQGGISYFTPKKTGPRPKDAAFQLYANKQEAEAVDKIGVVVRFKECRNLHRGSLVKHKGVQIGKVMDLQFADNLNDILVSLQIDKQAESFFRRDTRIWLEEAQVSFSGIKNLKSVLFGSYVSVLPGGGPRQRQFAALAEPPATPAQVFGGLNLILTSKHLGSLTISSPVYYRQVEIGKVVNYRLSSDFKSVEIQINIGDQYRSIIRENTKFWKASGTTVEGGLFSGLSISTESLEALLSGGIALATPDNAQMGKPVGNYHRFELHKKSKDEWLDWQPSITLLERESGKDPRENNP